MDLSQDAEKGSEAAYVRARFRIEIRKMNSLQNRDREGAVRGGLFQHRAGTHEVYIKCCQASARFEFGPARAVRDDERTAHSAGRARLD
jgi:hypothetical protein